MPKNRKEKDARYDEKRAGARTRSWTFILYPESEPKNWRDVLDNEHIEWIESPLHDRDINPNGEPKKPHRHILLMYPVVKTYEQVKELTDALNAPIPQKCNGAKGLVRYMVHMDNPEKAQYRTSDIIAHGGADIAELLKPSSSERYVLIGEMMDFIQSENIVEFEDLCDYARSQRLDDWFPLLCDNSTIVMREFIKSRRHRKPKTIDYSTGEMK